MTDEIEQTVRGELFDAPTVEMTKYLAHFQGDADQFAATLASATRLWRGYQDAVCPLESEQPHLVWSAAYLLNAINAALVSTRLFLLGYFAASGNQARHAIESTAFGILMAFPETSIPKRFKLGHRVEYKAVEYLKKNRKACGVNESTVDKMLEAVKWYDNHSHASKFALAGIWNPAGTGAYWIGGFFNSELLSHYRDEMEQRLLLSGLLVNAIAGLHSQLVERGILSMPSNVRLSPPS